MISGDFHTHSTFCDGDNSLRAMAVRAIKNNLLHQKRKNCRI